MQRAEKKELVDALHDTFNDMEFLVVTRQVGLTVAQMTALRRSVRAAGGTFRVTKNRLAKLAIDGTAFEPAASMFSGPTAVAFSAEPVSAAKAVVDFADSNNKLEIVGGVLSGQLIDAEGVKQLAKMPPIEEFQAKILGLLNAPATGVARILNVPAGDLTRVVGAPGSDLARVFAAYGAKTDA